MTLTAVVEKAAVKGAVSVEVLGVDICAVGHQNPGNFRELAFVGDDLVEAGPAFVTDYVEVDPRP